MPKAEGASAGGEHNKGEVDDEEFLSITQSPAEARLLRKALQQLSGGGAGPTLQEMAREVLSGRIGLREAASHSAYGEELISQSSGMHAEWDSMSETERELQAEQGRLLIEDEQREMASERRKKGDQRGKHASDGWSLY